MPSAAFLNDEGGVLERFGRCVTGRRKSCQFHVNFNSGGRFLLSAFPEIGGGRPQCPSSSPHTMSSCLNKMRVVRKGNLGGVPSSSSNVSGEEHPQMDISEFRGSQPNVGSGHNQRAAH